MISQGTITRRDQAWPRLPGAARYVQDVVEAEGEEVSRWVMSDATIMICGGAVGIASAVDAQLSAAIGEAEFERLNQAGRYRRYIY